MVHKVDCRSPPEKTQQGRLAKELEVVRTMLSEQRRRTRRVGGAGAPLSKHAHSIDSQVPSLEISKRS